MEISGYFPPLQRLAEMQRNLETIQQYKNAGRKSVELKINQWVTPFGLVPIAAFAQSKGMTITTGRNTQKVKSYLRLIHFPRGISNLDWVKRSTYLPLSKLSIETGDQHLTKYEHLILEKIENQKIRSSFQNALKYLTSEMVTNIKEHAQVDRYWLVAQYWSKTETCEIAIADSGIGYKESYRGTSFEVESHVEAIRNAIHGCSSKDDIERGTGIPGMINIFCKGYGGCIAIMSGDSLLYMEKNKEDYYSLEVDWDGVFIGLQFKLSRINALKYLSGN